MAKQNFIVVSNRLPVTVTKQDGKLIFNASPGGLATAMSSIKSDTGMLWVGWPGINSEDLTAAEKRQIIEELKAFSCVPVFLSARQVEDFYEGYSNETLWPLFHYFQSLARFNEEHWQAYKDVNALFAKAALQYAEKESTIWIHDYHLVLLPKQLREALPAASIGFFLHIPFPSFEIFRLLPHRNELLEGLLGADLVGFHIYDYVRHFMSSVMRTLGHESNNGSIIYGERIVKADAFPIGIDYQKFQTAVTSQAVKQEIALLKDHYNGKKIILSVDRLDYSKGIANRLEAFEQFLKQHTEYHKKVTLVVIAVPSRTEVNAYRELRDVIEQTVSRINGTYATVDWVPVAYQFQNQPFDKLVALYAKADIALVTPIRDGMNLVAKEYVASKQKASGVLILSELAGAVDELPEALVVNPNDTASIVKAMETALAMPLRQKKVRLAAMQRRISSYDVDAWANDFLEQLVQSKQQQNKHHSRLITGGQKAALVHDYQRAKKRLIILDYDGTLKEFIASAQASQASPSRTVLQLLKDLSGRSGNTVYIVSGRPKEALESWFGGLDIQLVAEHGYWIKQNGRWMNHRLNTDNYKKLVLPTLIKYTERTPGAVIEDKSSSLVWHYRNVTPELAYMRKANLKRDLSKLLSESEADVFTGHKILEVKPRSISKGVIVDNLLQKRKFDFVLCCGDDYTDEDMFSVLPDSQTIHSIKVGLGETDAKYQVSNVKKMIDLLKSLQADQ